MEDNTTVIRVDFGEPGQRSHLVVTWSQEIEVLLIQGDACYRGCLRLGDLENFYKNLRQTKEEYLENIKKALTTKHGSREYLFELRDSSLYWKVASENGIKIIYGSLKFSDVLEEGGRDILVETLYRLNKNLEKKVKVRDAEMLEMHGELQDFSKKFEVFSNTKNKMEEDIYQKFLAILNEKKRKIRLLQDLVEENTKEKTNQNREKKTDRHHQFVDSDSE